jgi:hypothetical protein
VGEVFAEPDSSKGEILQPGSRLILEVREKEGGLTLKTFYTLTKMQTNHTKTTHQKETYCVTLRTVPKVLSSLTVYDT